MTWSSRTNLLILNTNLYGFLDLTPAPFPIAIVTLEACNHLIDSIGIEFALTPTLWGIATR
jgi:hypothetical protein